MLTGAVAAHLSKTGSSFSMIFPSSIAYLGSLPKEGSVIHSKAASYKVLKLIGKGGFGAVYLASYGPTNELVAAKCEFFHHPRKALAMDYTVLKKVEGLRSVHFCKVIEGGKVENEYRYIIITLIGASLFELRMTQPELRFSLGTSIRLAEQSLQALQDMHKIGFIHRDVKPSNFCIGRRDTNEHHIVFVVDFGLARRFLDDNNMLRAPRIMTPFRGTPRYASLSAHYRKEQSPKDDVESWLYMVIEWTSGSLPWRCFLNEERDQILIMKEGSREPAGLRWLFERCPTVHFEKILTYLDSLDYSSRLDYGFIYYILRHAFKAYNISPTQELDFDPGAPYAGPEVSLDGFLNGSKLDVLPRR